MKLSAKQRFVLFMAPCYVHRGEVRTARSLERMGLGVLEDNGRMKCDSARWHFTLTGDGQAARTRENENMVAREVIQ